MLVTTRPHHLLRGRRALALLTLACVPLAACGSDDGARTVRSNQGTAGNDTGDTAGPAASTTTTTPPDTTTTLPDVAGSIASVVYEFHDASLPPEYHRSYTVTVTDGSATVVVDSYGDVKAQDTQPIDAAVWALTVDGAAALAGTPSQENTGCAGGTADELTALDAAGTEVVHVFVDHCGATGGPDLSTVVSSVLASFDLASMTAVG